MIGFKWLFGGRPFNLSDQKAGPWLQRAQDAASLVALLQDLHEPIRVVDLGAGDKKLAAVLGRSCRIDYTGYDILPQSPDVRPWDAGQGLPSDLGDIVFALGLLEYVDSPEAIFGQFAARARFVIFSYVTSDAARYSPQDLERLGWKTHHSAAEIEALLRASGLEVMKRIDKTADAYSIWLARPRTAGVRRASASP